MIFIRLPLILVFVALLAACSDNQKAAENNQTTVQKELTPEGYKLDVSDFESFVSKQPTKEMFAKLQKEAEAGDAEMQNILGEMYIKGDGVPKDAAKAVEWYQKAATQGHAKAQYALGKIHSVDGEISLYHSAKAKEWYEKAAEQGYVKAQEKLGFYFWLGVFGKRSPSDYAEALKWSQKAAEQGSPLSQFVLGMLYSDGTGVRKDAAKAFEWYLKAAEGGHNLSQGLVGEMYYKGVGVLKNAEKAFEWYLKAAANGNAGAQVTVGKLYYHGKGVPKDFAKAADWYQKAAAQGNADAQVNLALLYYFGEGVSKNILLAYVWSNLAAAHGLESAIKSRGLLEKELTAAQRAEGQRLASNWKKGDILQATNNNPAGLALPPDSKPSKQGTGTAFTVSSEGHALTNHHVIDGCKEIRVAGQDGAIKVVTSDTVNDLALLQMPGRANAAALTDNPAKLRQGEDVVVYGYPLNAVLSSGGNLTPGTVSALSGLGNNTNQIQITAPIQPGSSGSPVLDKKGNVVGVVSMKLSDSKMAKATGQIGQNVNFAVNGQTVKAFLDANKVSYKTGGGFFSREKSNADIAEEARKWTVVLECWK